MPTERLLTVAEMAKALRVSPRETYRLAARGELAGIRCGRQWRFVLNDSLVALREATERRQAGR